MNWGVFVSTFLAATIEVIEMVAIVVAVGVTRSWRASLLGAAGGLVVLVVIVGALGTALQDVSLKPIRLVVGRPPSRLWLSVAAQRNPERLARRLVRRHRRGRDRPGCARGLRLDRLVPLVQGRLLEGLEVAVIVVAFGAAAVRSARRWSALLPPCSSSGRSGS